MTRGRFPVGASGAAAALAAPALVRRRSGWPRRSIRLARRAGLPPD
jgi:hypothetical protein